MDIVGGFYKKTKKAFNWLKEFFLNTYVLTLLGVFGLVIWCVEAFIDFFFYYEEPYLDILLFNIPRIELYTRVFSILVFIVFSLMVSFVFVSKRKTEKRKRFLHSLLRHDVQNKNQVIEGYLELMKEKEIDEELKKYIDKALKAVKQSEEIINKVRAMKKIGKEEIKEIDLASLLNDLSNEVKSRAKEKNIDVEVNCPKDISEVRGGALLRDLFKNLLDNALRHSQGNKIKISAIEKKNKVICSVEDDGIGIPDKKKQKVFEKGFKDKKTGKTGLGLFLIQKIAKSYGGGIRVKDSELGGARFDVYLEKTSKNKLL